MLGGIGNIRGAVLGGFILGFLEVLASGYIPNGAEWRDVHLREPARVLVPRAP